MRIPKYQKNEHLYIKGRLFHF